MLIFMLRNDQALRAVSANGDLSLVRELLHRGSASSSGYVHTQNDQALILAAGCGHLAVVQELLIWGADSNKLNAELSII